MNVIVFLREPLFVNRWVMSEIESVSVNIPESRIRVCESTVTHEVCAITTVFGGVSYGVFLK